MPWHKPHLQDGRLTYHGRSVELTRNQYIILRRLLAAKPKIVAWQDLYQEITGSAPEMSDDKLVKVHVFNLRRRLREAEIEMVIETRRQWGYRVFF